MFLPERMIIMTTLFKTTANGTIYYEVEIKISTGVFTFNICVGTENKKRKIAVSHIIEIKIGAGTTSRGSVDFVDFQKTFDTKESANKEYNNKPAYSITHGELKNYAYFILGREATSTELYWIEQVLFNKETGQIYRLIEQTVKDAESLQL